MRISTLPDQGFLIAGTGLLLRRPHREQGEQRSIAVGDFDPYYPVDPLAVSPDGRRAWVRGKGGEATRVDLETGAVERFDFALRDAVYGPDGRVVAVLDSQAEPALVSFDDRDPSAQRSISCPEPRPIHWPYGAPYQFAAYDLDWTRGALRLTATRDGVALAHVNGLLWARFTDGPERWRDAAWLMPPVYQGWACAYAHAQGLVVTSVHNGRTGDIVWLDREGVWHGCFDSNWRPLGPCVPSSRGFVTGIDDALLRFEGSPPEPCEQAFIGGRIEDLALDRDGDRVALHFGDRVAQTHDAGAIVQVWIGDEVDTLSPERLGEPLDQPPWRYQAIDDPDLGRLWKPDLARASALADALRGRPDLAAALRAALPGPALDGEDDADADLLPLILRRLRRWVPVSLSRARLTRVIARLADMGGDPAGQDEFLRSALQAALPEALREADIPSAPADADAWIRDRIPGLFEGIYTGEDGSEQRIRHATVVADLQARPVWSLIVELEGGQSLRVTLEDFDPASASAPPSEVADEYAVVKGNLWRPGSSEGEAVVSTLDPFAGGFAQRVVVGPPRSGQAYLRTGALFEPAVLERPDDARVLSYGADTWPTLHIGRLADGRLGASPFADDLEDPQLYTKPSPLPAMGTLLAGLIADELLELVASADDDLLWAVEAAVAGAPIDQATQALEDLLLDHKAVDELFAAPEQLRAHILALSDAES